MMNINDLKKYIEDNLSLPNNKDLSEYGKGFRDGTKIAKNIILRYIETSNHPIIAASRKTATIDNI